MTKPPETGSIRELTMHEQQQIDDALNALGGCWSVNDYKGAQRVMRGFLREIQRDAAPERREEQG